jgi:hypothetical protein
MGYAKKWLGCLINSNAPLVKQGIKRTVDDLRTLLSSW